MNQTSQIKGVTKQAAYDAGFDLVGIAPVHDFSELDHFPKWIADGHAGEMKYMEARDEAGRLKRASLRSTVPWARSVIVCAINYNTEQPYSTQVNDPQQGWISRYAWGREDYHEAVMRRLRQVEAKLRGAFMTSGAEALRHSGEPTAALKRCSTPKHSAQKCSTQEYSTQEYSTQKYSTQKYSTQKYSTQKYSTQEQGSGERITLCYVDTGPLVERVYAKYAGVGWIGKNTCILNQKLGSWLFLGVILTSLELEPDVPAPDRCGSCTRCIDACPTDALIAPYQLDSNKCISYLTIEKRGAIPEEMREGMGRHVFGCDICQDVCPWNRKSPVTSAAEFQPQEGLVNPALEWLAGMTAEEFRETFRGSPVRRTKRTGLRRNAVIAMGNSRDRRFVPVLEKLVQDEDPVVAEHAHWAKGRVGSPDR